MASLINQVKEAMDTINGIGTSKFESMQANSGKSPEIHSIKYYKETMGDAIRFTSYCKDNFDVKSIFSLTSEHLSSYMKNLTDKGLANGTLINIESHLSKFQNAVDSFGAKIGKDSPVFFSDRKIDHTDRESPVDRSYTKQEINELIRNVSLKVGNAMEASFKLGLRVKEVSNLRVEHLTKDKVIIENGRGVTKGGRFREISIPKNYQKKLEKLINGKKPNEKVFGVKDSTLRSALKRACQKTNIISRGWHGFRHTYAREKLKEVLGDNYDKCKEILSRIIDNQKKGIRMDAGIKKIERRYYNELKRAINLVHSELGHGRKRWELIKVYMS